jgi:predicted nuclease with TOPRIM domain
MNTREIGDKISALEKEKAQLELREQQIKQNKADLEEKLKERNLKAKDLEPRIKELEAEIERELDKLNIGSE